MSEYEYKQVLRLIEEVYKQYGVGLDKEEFCANCWVAYFERKNRKYVYTNYNFWQRTAEHMIIKAKAMRAERNRKISMEGKISLNQRYLEDGEEIGSILFPVQGNFTNGIDLWDYAERLGKEKYQILCYMSQGEDEIYIMRKMHLPVNKYYAIKEELRKDMDEYINI